MHGVESYDEIELNEAVQYRRRPKHSGKARRAIEELMEKRRIKELTRDPLFDLDSFDE